MMEWYTPVLWSRVILFILQVIFNSFPDHKADAFNPDEVQPASFLDFVVKLALDGFHKWDAKYFIYIADNGYEQEQMFAFFPLVPLSIRYVGHFIFTITFQQISHHYCNLMAGFAINTAMFFGSAKALYRLTDITFKNKKFSTIVQWLFCFNPASIFFSAIYTEAAYSCFVFNAMSCLLEHRSAMATVWFMLASSTRSNGVVNAFFIAYYQLKLLFDKCHTEKHNAVSCESFSILFKAALSCALVLLPFVSFNLFGYIRFCGVTDLSFHSWKQVTNCSAIPQFCCDSIPLIYQHVQKHHWDLGFLAYYKFRKLPNFLLAVPITCTVIYGAVHYLSVRHHETKYLGLLSTETTVATSSSTTTHLVFASKNIFCFVVNALALITFALLFMHVEVSTRFLFSSSPFPYWVVSSFLIRDLMILDASTTVSWRCFNKLTPISKVFIVYFLGYFIMGTALHVNFLPWT